MKLLEMQRLMAEDVMRPTVELLPARVESYVKPNDRLTSMERLEIYSRQYMSRLVDSFQDDFPGLKIVLGSRTFSKLAEAYIRDCPSRSFTLRDLGQSLTTWLAANPQYAGRRSALALDMARLEWAHIEAFDGAEAPALSAEDLAALNPKQPLGLQPHVRLLELQYPVDELRVRKLKFRAAKQIFLAIHRVDGDVYYRRLEPGEFGLLQAIASGLPLIKVLESAEPHHEHLQRWFATWAQLGWLTRSSAKRRVR